MESVVWYDSVLPSLAGDYLVRFADGSLAVCPYLAESYRFDMKAEVIEWTDMYEMPSASCVNCYRASWYDLFGRMVFCCDLSWCYHDDEF